MPCPLRCRLPLLCLALVACPSTRAEPEKLPPGALFRLGKPQPTVKDALQSVAYSPDSKVLAWVTAREGGGVRRVVIHLGDVARKKELRTCVFAEDTARATSPIAFSPDAKAVALGTYHESGGPAKSTRGADVKVRLWEVATGKELDRFPVERGDTTTTFAILAFSAGGKELVATLAGRLKRWDAASGRARGDFTFFTEDDSGFVWQVLSPDGKALAARLNNDPIRLLDAATGKVLRRIPGGGAPLAFSGDGKLLAAAGTGTVHVWEVATGKERCRLKGKTQVAALTRDGKVLAWLEEGKGIHLVEVPTGKELRTLPEGGGAMAFSPDGKRLATERADGTVLVWRVN